MQGVVLATAIQLGRLFGVLQQSFVVFDNIGFAGNADVQIDASHTKSIDFSIQIPNQLDSFIPITIGTNAFNLESLSHEISLKSVITL